MRTLKLGFYIFGRFCLSLVFLAGALNKILHWGETEKLLHQTLCEWQTYLGYSDSIYECFGMFISFVPLLLLIACIFELVGGLLVLTGLKEKFGIFLLLGFLVPTTVLMHQFWFVDEITRQAQLTHFCKNLALIGALFMLLFRVPEKPSILSKIL